MNRVKIDDFCNYHHLGNLKIAEDGKHALFSHIKADLQEDKYLGNLYILNLDTNKYRPITSGNNEKNAIWYDNETIVFTGCRNEKIKEKIKQNETWTIFYKLNIHQGEAEEWFTLPMQIASYEKIDDTYLVVNASCRRDIKNFYECENEEERNNYKNHISSFKQYEYFDEIPFWANGSGIINQKRSRLFIVNTKTLEVEAISSLDANATLAHIKNHKILYISNPMKDVRVIPSSLHMYDMETKEDSTLIKDGEVNIQWAFFNKDSIMASLSTFETYGYHQHGSIYRIDFDGNKTKLTHFDNSYGASLGSDCLQQVGNSVKAYKDKIYFSCTDINNGCMKCFDENGNNETLSGYHGGIESFDICEKGIYFIGLRDEKLQEIYHLENLEETQITSFNSEIMNTSSFSPIETMTFVSDGITHTGFVIKPVDYDPNKKYPGILKIHGGPKATYGPVIDHERQFLANNGYFVIYCNPRGSDGQGNEFADIRGRFGKEDYVDFMNFVDAVLKQYPALDEKRLGVSGSSYGGYMTNWIITQTDRFAAAIAEASISNYITKFLTTDIGFTYNISNQAADPWSDLALVWEQSPLKYANKVKTPTLFIHNDEDYRCWMAEAIQMYYALKMHGCTTHFLMFHKEHHGMRIFGKPSNRVQRLKAMLEWYNKYL